MLISNIWNLSISKWLLFLCNMVLKETNIPLSHFHPAGWHRGAGYHHLRGLHEVGGSQPEHHQCNWWAGRKDLIQKSISQLGFFSSLFMSLIPMAQGVFPWHLDHVSRQRHGSHSAAPGWNWCGRITSQRHQALCWGKLCTYLYHIYIYIHIIYMGRCKMICNNI